MEVKKRERDQPHWWGPREQEIFGPVPVVRMQRKMFAPLKKKKKKSSRTGRVGEMGMWDKVT